MTVSVFELEKIFNAYPARHQQIEMTACALESMRANYAKQWKAVHKLPKNSELQGFKEIIKSMIRRCDESANHVRSVSYVSARAVDQIRKAISKHPKQHFIGSHLDGLRHEHMTPVEVVFAAITHESNLQVPIALMLRTLCVRALIHPEDDQQLNQAKFKSTLPPALLMPNASALLFTQQPLELLQMVPLLRYYAVDLELALNLQVVDTQSHYAEYWERLQQSTLQGHLTLEQWLAQQAWAASCLNSKSAFGPI